MIEGQALSLVSCDGSQLGFQCSASVYCRESCNSAPTPKGWGWAADVMSRPLKLGGES